MRSQRAQSGMSGHPPWFYRHQLFGRTVKDTPGEWEAAMPTWVFVLIAIVVLVLAWRFLARPWLDKRVTPHQVKRGSTHSEAEERLQHLRNMGGGNPGGG